MPLPHSLGLARAAETRYKKGSTDPQPIEAKAGAMNSLDNPARQAARTWSSQLGSLAAASPATRPEAASPHFDAAPPADLSTRLSAILSHFRQRRARQQHAAEELRAREFLTGT
jgi:hypothetical protein